MIYSAIDPLEAVAWKRLVAVMAFLLPIGAEHDRKFTIRKVL
jgi:hypothetical protein